MFDEVYLANESNLQIATTQNTEIAHLELELATQKLIARPRTLK